MDFAAQSKKGAGIARLLRPSFLYRWLATTLADFETNNIAGGHCQNSVIVRLNHRLLLQLSCRRCVLCIRIEVSVRFRRWIAFCRKTPLKPSEKKKQLKPDCLRWDLILQTEEIHPSTMDHM
jgi:hypothetical protein